MTSELTLNLEHTCGHFQLHDLSTKPSHEREDFAEWLSSKECTSCWKKNPSPVSRKRSKKTEEEVQAERREKYKLVLVWEKRCEMPQLNGTHRQEEWAQAIRFNLLEVAYTNRGSMSDEEFIIRFEEPAKRFLESKFWIDNRDVEVNGIEALLNSQLAESIS